MDQDLKKQLSQDPDGLLTYEYIANHIGQCDDIMPELVDNMILVDKTGQFVASRRTVTGSISLILSKVSMVPIMCFGLPSCLRLMTISDVYTNGLYRHAAYEPDICPLFLRHRGGFEMPVCRRIFDFMVGRT